MRVKRKSTVIFLFNTAGSFETLDIIFIKAQTRLFHLNTMKYLRSVTRLFHSTAAFKGLKIKLASRYYVYFPKIHARTTPPQAKIY